VIFITAKEIHKFYEPERVIKMREGGRNFIVINDEVAKEKKGGKRR